MNLKQQISLIITEIQQTDQNISEIDLLKRIVKLGIDKKLASDLLTFIPIAMCREILPNFHFPASYIEKSKYNEDKEIKYKHNSVYMDVEIIIRSILASGFSQDSVLKIAGRSPEFHVINDFLLKGVDIDNIALGLVHIDKNWGDILE